MVIALIVVLFGLGGVLILLSTRRQFRKLHDRAMGANPIYRLLTPKGATGQRIYLFVARMVLRGVGIAALVFALVQIVFNVAFYVFYVAPFRGQAFDAETWAAAAQCDGPFGPACGQEQPLCTRGPMVRDLLRHHIIRSQSSRQEVVATIGPDEYDVQLDDGRICSAYHLGICSGLGIDYDALYVCYGPDDVVASAGTIQH